MAKQVSIILLAVTLNAVLILANDLLSRERILEFRNKIQKCAELHNFTAPPEFLSRVDPDLLPGIINTTCVTFPPFFKCFQRDLEAVMKLMNPRNSVTVEQVNQFHHTVCAEENFNTSICFFSPTPGGSYTAMKTAEYDCRWDLSEMDSSDRCAYSKAMLACQLPRVEADVHCGGEKAVNILRGIATFELQGNGC